MAKTDVRRLHVLRLGHARSEVSISWRDRPSTTIRECAEDDEMLRHTFETYCFFPKTRVIPRKLLIVRRYEQR